MVKKQVEREEPNQIIKKKEAVIEKINFLLNNYKNKMGKPTNSDLREIQNAIFSLRNQVNKIPDWLYRVYKNSYESLTDSSIRMKINEISR